MSVFDPPVVLLFSVFLVCSFMIKSHMPHLAIFYKILSATGRHIQVKLNLRLASGDNCQK